ncbi:hypothetical protein ET445_03255 [Agromyces protaetiae]|uniref:Uncharacterized protein n=1 Tax=Agromyces protaetiae TaxID=2509455 RepID=A0A4P6FC45_9MICO|nr:hypothetical protein [Agromyces protaetiae]QAY72503.1 hypothetical protein ET445_03255 [Agromyces protaetiae]
MPRARVHSQVPPAADFENLLIAHDISLGAYRTPDSGGCVGGITTTVTVSTRTSGDHELWIDGCQAPDGTFEDEATDLFSDYREGH